MTEWHNVFQPIYYIDKDMNPTISHYEMLLRDKDNRFPINDFFRIIRTEEDNLQWIEAERASLDRLFALHPNVDVNLNIEPIQFAFPSVWEFLDELCSKYGNNIDIEITERQLQSGTLGIRSFDESFKRIKKMGFNISLDDVDSGNNSFSFVSHHADLISSVKLSLLIFDDVSIDTKIKFIDAWIAFAKEKNLDIVLEAVRTKEIAQRYCGDDHIFQQGFYWHKYMDVEDVRDTH